MAEHECWQCGTADAGSLFCRYCDGLQSPQLDYFSFFGIERRLKIDADHLKRQFYTLSRLLHPDKYTHRSEVERRNSLDATAILNDGFRILRDPIERAEYVLRVEGFEPGEQRNKDVPPELLEEVFELNMALDELGGGDREVVPQLESYRRHFLEMQSAIDSEIEEVFSKHDSQSTPDARRAVLAEIRSILNRRRYIQNLIGEVDKALTARDA
jgi:molecular chaperone HscB